MPRFLACSLLRYGNHVDRTKLSAILGIGFCFKCDFLPLFQSAEALRLNGGEMHKNVVATFVIGNESISFSVIEPFNCSVHNVTSCGAVCKTFGKCSEKFAHLLRLNDEFSVPFSLYQSCLKKSTEFGTFFSYANIFQEAPPDSP